MVFHAAMNNGRLLERIRFFRCYNNCVGVMNARFSKRRSSDKTNW